MAADIELVVQFNYQFRRAYSIYRADRGALKTEINAKVINYTGNYPSFIPAADILYSVRRDYLSCPTPCTTSYHTCFQMQ